MNLLEPKPQSKTYERTLYTVCPICDSDKFTLVRSSDCSAHPMFRTGLPDKIYWNKCLNDSCQHVFTSGYFEGESAKYLFGSTQQSQTPGYNIEQGRYTAADMIERIRSFSGINFGRWLDVGFGAGHLLTTASEYGYHVVGTDLRETSCATLKSFGFDVKSIQFQDIENDGFDIISMADVLEHIPFPVEALKHIKRLLRPSGALFVSCPNTDSFVWKALDKANQNPFWSELEHYHNFGCYELKRLLKETGFKTFQYNVSRRYRACMEVIAVRQ